MERRELIKASLAAFISLTLPSLANQKEKSLKKNTSNILQPRIVVIGGGWSGLSFATHIVKIFPMHMSHW